MRKWILLTSPLIAICLGGCVSMLEEGAQQQVNPLPLLHDTLFPQPAASFELESAPDFLELPANFKQELDNLVMPLETEYERYKRLRQWVFRKFEDYDFTSLETTSLAQLNNNRKINCLSFSTFFVAAARYVNVPADFQLVFAPPYWDKKNNSWINNQHINVTGLVKVPADQMYLPSTSTNPNEFWLNSSLKVKPANYRYVADVNPAIVSTRLKRQIITEQEVLSFYYSNRSVESLLKGDLGVAYHYSKAALLAYPNSALAWNNLGVLYNRIGRTDHAGAAYRQAIALDEMAYSAKSNLARVYMESGDVELAQALEEEVDSFRIENPYYHAALAEDSYEAGNLEAAKRHLEAAVERKHNEHHFYHQLAIVYQALGNEEEVLKNLQFARRFARGTEKSRFAGKLEQLDYKRGR